MRENVAVGFAGFGNSPSHASGDAGAIDRYTGRSGPVEEPLNADRVALDVKVRNHAVTVDTQPHWQRHVHGRPVLNVHK